MEQRSILILTAIKLEAEALVKTLHLRRETPTRWRGEYAQAKIVLHIVGIKALAWQRLVNPGAAYDGVILAGLAGALTPALQIGDVLIDATYAPSPPDALGIKTTHLGKNQIHVKPIYSSTELVATPQAKQKLHELTQAWAVEMEAHRVRKHFGAFAPPEPAFLHIRGISDAAADAVDPVVFKLVDGLGRPRLWQILKQFAQQPTLPAKLWRLSRASHLAKRNMAQVVRHYIDAGWPWLPE